jgi:hypothetical protein
VPGSLRQQHDQVIAGRAAYSGGHCTVCFTDQEHVLRAACGHYHCSECVRGYVESNLTAEYLWPPRCCRGPLPPQKIEEMLCATDSALRDQYLIKSVEYATPASHRVYCPTPTCSEYLGASDDPLFGWHCQRCNQEICVRCKDFLHPWPNCVPREDREFLQLSGQQGWVNCSACGAMVERTEGCNHMTCRCGKRFCYVCGGDWHPDPFRCYYNRVRY